MAILPLQLTRISNSLRAGITQRSLARNQQAMLEAQNQLATGIRIHRPSDDPVDAAMIQQLRKTLEMRTGYADNLRYAASHLGETSSALGELTDLLREAQTLASANVGSDVSADQRASAAVVAESLYNQAVSLANRQFNGAYLFGGDSAAAPFAGFGNGVRFGGSEAVLQNRYDQNAILPFMANANEVFGALSAAVTSADISPRLTADTRLVDLRGALDEGVRRGAFVLSNGTESKVIDLSTAETVGDVIDAINSSAVGEISAEINGDGAGISLSAGAADEISIVESGGNIAADLGLLKIAPEGPGAPLFGLNPQPTVTQFTRLADLRGGQGIDQAAGLIITNGVTTATIDIADAVTVEDLLNRINTSGTQVIARLRADGRGIEIVNPVQGSPMTIAENGGTTATDLGIRTFGPATLVSTLNGGKGVRTADGTDIRITRQDGTTFEVDLSGLLTVQEVIDAINAADGGGGVIAGFSETGNAIVLTDSSAGDTPLTVSRMNFSLAADDLGLLGTLDGAVLTGRDVSGVEPIGLIANLAKLRDALIRNDQNGITESAELLQADLDRSIRLNGEVGARAADVERRQDRIEDQDVATRAILSQLEDTDYNEAITRFQTLQTTLQANLQTAGTLMNLSLLDFLR